MNGWIGVDLDATLAEYHGWHGDGSIGEPVPAMVERVKRWLAMGQEVRILTARASVPDAELAPVVERIEQWCLKHIGQKLEVTCRKDFAMIELWDDRAVQVEANTGRPVGHSTRGLD